MIDDFDTWFEVNKVVNRYKPLKEQFEECWKNSRGTLAEDNNKLEAKISKLEDEVRDLDSESIQLRDTADNQELILSEVVDFRERLNKFIDDIGGCETFADFKDDYLKRLEELAVEFNKISIDI